MKSKFSHLGLLIFTVLSAYAEDWNGIETVENNFDTKFLKNHHYTIHDHKKVVACFFNSWAYYKKGSSSEGQYDIESHYFEGNLCTHLIYKFGFLDNDALKIKHMDNHLDITLGLYAKVVKLKEKYPHLKILIGVGGSHESQRLSFNHLVNSNKQKLFIQNAVKYIRKNGFDGMHLNWQFPYAADKEGFVNLARESKEVFQKNNLLLTSTMAGFIDTINLSYDVFEVTRIFDLVFIQSYGYYTKKNHTRHQSSLRSNKEDFKNTFDVLKFIILDRNANTDNLVLGVPFYGYMYYLSEDSSSQFGLDEEVSKTMKLGYGEICKGVIADNGSGNESLSWNMFWDGTAKAAFGKSGNRWLTFTSPRAVYDKVELVNEWGMRGIMVSSIDYDDFLGQCTQNESNPLLKAINYALMATKFKRESRLCRELNALSNVRKFTPNSTEIVSTKGSSLYLHCLVEGNPLNSIMWYMRKYGEDARIPVHENMNEHLPYYFTNYPKLNCSRYKRILSVLTVKHLGQQNVGDYYCKVTDGGYQTAKIQFRLALEPEALVKETPENSVSPWPWLAIFLMIALFTIPVCRIFYKKYKRKIILSEYDIKQFLEGSRLRSTSNDDIKLKEMENLDTLPYNNSYEIVKGDYNVEIDNVLGSGAFGIVFRGRVLDRDVAVKSVRNEGDRMSILSLLAELKIMIHLENHPNIVNLIGAYTSELRTGVAYVFVEYCPHGNLLNYLRKSRESFVSLMDKDNDNYIRYSQLAEISTEEITEEHLVNWSRQIACGLGYLRTKKIIHGDLAARNILVFAKDSVKLTDFGLSRKLYVYSNYKYQKTNYEEPLPWRWMALESLRDLCFSFDSDMWSFGVTLWELFSLGEVPYSGMSWTVEFIEMLKNDIRIPKPSYATTSLYNLLLKCWHQNPGKRPKPIDLEQYFIRLSESFN